MTTHHSVPPRLPTLHPHIRLLGGVDEAMLKKFLDDCDRLEGDGPVVLELSTTGGEAETARRLAQDIRMLARTREVFFLGKSYVYSAGITLLAAVPPSHRFLTHDTMLLIHERRFERELRLSGALRSVIAVTQDLLAELEVGEAIERRGFERFVEGSDLTSQQLTDRVLHKDWYMGADEALSLKLVAGLVG